LLQNDIQNDIQHLSQSPAFAF